MSGRYRALRLQAAAFFALAVGAVPADPTITSHALLPRQNDADFIGFLEQSGTWYSETCDSGGTWYQNGNYAQCCPTTLASCYAPTACIRGTLIFPVPDRSTTISLACTENFPNQTPAASICNTAFIFENFGDSNPKTDIVCGPSSVNWSYYRKIPASATAVSSQPPGSLQQPAPASSGLGSLSTNNNDNNNSSRSGSKAWIAGAVIGPIVGLALIGLLVFCCLRRKKKNEHAALQQGSASMAQVHPNQPPAGVAGHTDAKPQPHQQHYNNADPYVNAGLNAGTFATSGGYNNAPSPPMAQSFVGMPPQNTGSAAYNAGTTSYNTSPAPYNAGPAPYNAPISPPPQQAYGNDVKQTYMAAPQGQTTGGHTSGQKTQTAELGGSAAGAATAPSELPSGKTTWVDTLTNL